MIERPSLEPDPQRAAANNKNKVATDQRLMDAEFRLDDARQRCGISEAMIAKALESVDPDISQQHDDEYASTLACSAGALGGYLEVRAVSREETVILLREPAEHTNQQ
jgi:hypothetical protein